MISLSVAGLAAGYTFNSWQQKNATIKTKPTSEVAASTVRPLFKLKDLEGKVRDVKEWDGKVIMVNFWATWCPPCRKEMPAFVEIQDKYKDQGFVILGIALDEKQAVIDFADSMGVNYPILMAEQEGIGLSKAYGNRLGVLPYTVVIDRKGNITHRQRTELNYKQVEGMIKPLL